MSLIAMCAYCTEENGKLECLKETLDSIEKTVDWSKHRMWITDNSPTSLASQLLVSFLNKVPVTIVAKRENLGTAGGINLALKERKEGEFFVKCDDDWSTEHTGWVDELEKQILNRPEIGILGLKRYDVYGTFIEEGDLLWSHDIFGTCTMLNPAMLDKVGGYVQISDFYGFDDTIMSVRSEAAGFKNAFYSPVKITNLDLKETPYTEWKKREAGLYLQEASIYMDKIKKGEISYFVEL